MERRLAAILAADVVGYSRLMEEDEEATAHRLNAYREVIDGLIDGHHGRVFGSAGDSVIAEFASPVEAVRCAVEIQRSLERRNADLLENRRMRFRIGINLGDVLVEGDNLLGDGVNIAARLEGLAGPGGICIRRAVRNQVRDKLPLDFEDLGEIEVKNIARPVRVFRVLWEPAAAGKVIGDTAKTSRIWKWPAVAAAAGVVLAAAGALLLQPWKADVEPAAVEKMALPLPEKPSIAVLPFKNLSDDPIQNYLAEGIAEDIITDLSKISGLFVIARNSSFAYKGKQTDLRTIARELGVKYVLEGSVRRAGAGIRINAQLIDAMSGGHIWAERYDGAFADVFTLQDKVIEQIVAGLAVTLTDSEEAALARLPTTNLEAYDYYLRAEHGLYSGDGYNVLPHTLAAYEKAIEIDPDFAEAQAGYARVLADVWRQDWSNLMPPAVARKKAYRSAARAVELNPKLPRPYSVLGVLQLVDREFDRAIESGRKAVALGPNDADAHANLALILAYSGNGEEAESAIATALRLNPKPAPGKLLMAGSIYSIIGRYDRALEHLERARDAMPTSELAREELTMAYAALGRLDDAQREREVVYRLFGLMSVAYYRHNYGYHRNAEDLAKRLDLLRKAGVHEWPFGFKGRPQDRLGEDRLESLTLGRRWVGRLWGGDPFMQEVSADGTAAMSSTNSFVTGRIWVRGDRLCQQFVFYLRGAAHCGRVYRNPEGSAEGKDLYVYVNIDGVKYFAPAD